MPEKVTVWAYFLRLTGAKDEYVRKVVANCLILCSSIWVTGIRFGRAYRTHWRQEDEYVRRTASDAFSKVFPVLSNKNQEYSDLVILANKINSYTLREPVTKLVADYPRFVMSIK